MGGEVIVSSVSLAQGHIMSRLSFSLPGANRQGQACRASTRYGLVKTVVTPQIRRESLINSLVFRHKHWKLSWNQLHAEGGVASTSVTTSITTGLSQLTASFKAFLSSLGCFTRTPKQPISCASLAKSVSENLHISWGFPGCPE